MRLLILLFLSMMLNTTDNCVAEPLSGSLKTQAPLGVPDSEPDYVGGYEALLQTIAKNLKYPQNCAKQGIEGRVVVKFEVTTKGTVGRCSIVTSVHPELDAEAMRVIKTCNKWIPGKRNGQVTSIWIAFPINFKLPSNTKPNGSNEVKEPVTLRPHRR